MLATKKSSDVRYDVEFILSYAEESSCWIDKRGKEVSHHREVYLPAITDDVKHALEQNLEQFFTGINEFPPNMVRVEVVRFDERKGA